MIYTFFISFLSACINTDNLKPLVPEYLLHANSSKVWLVENITQNEKIISPLLKERKLTLTFFEDRSVYFQKLIHLGSHNATKAIYSLRINDAQADTTLSFYFEKEEAMEFQVNYISHKKLILTQKHEVDSLVKHWKLVNLPKPS